nr:RHS repeat-associated core domain-containing protein [Neisseria subflava]
MPSKEENARNGLPETDWRDAQYDMLYLPVTETVRYHYDFNGNRTATVLPDGKQINYLYYGSGHLHQISLDDEVITDIERDKLHREIYRTQGKLASRYELDPLGRLKRQIATLNDLTEGGKGKTKVAAGYGQTAVKRSYGYDRTGNLTHSTDQRTGTTQFEYDKLGRITQAGNELFAFDPADNILSDDLSAIPDNRLKTYNGTTYYYDELGNLIHRELADGEVQNYFYDLHDQLVKAEIFKKDGSKETWAYTYDALGRRIGKGRLKDEEVSDGLEEKTGFVWDGSHLLQEIQPDGRYTYIYTNPDSYDPLAQVRNRTNEEGESCQQIHYFHCDQIGIPREMIDKDGNLLWLGNYTGWGRLKEETKVTDSAYQHFRLQNQYADRETGLHYNFFRYYEPDAGRFVNQDPIRLEGGENLYAFAPNAQEWVDPLGLARKSISSRLPEGSRTGQFGPKNGKLTKLDPQTRKPIQIRSYDARGNPIKDIDFGHNHGFGDPHAHDWRYPSDKAPNKVRGEGRVLTKAEKLHLKLGKCAQAFSGLTSLSTRFIGGIGLLLLPNSISQCQDLYYSMKNPDKCGAKNK